MANISRPFQVALAGVVVLAAVWLFALRGHSHPTESTAASGHVTASASGSSASAPTAAAGEKAAAAKTPIYHGSAPGVQGLSSAIAKAHGAVATSQTNAAQLEAKSAQASSPGSTSTPATSIPAASTPAASAPAASSAASSHTAPSAKPSTARTQTSAAASTKATHPSSSSSSTSTLTRQIAVEHAIAGGDVAVILFWNSKGADDRADAAAVRSLLQGHSHVAIELATSAEVAAFGTITRGVQVYGTPTVLVVGKSGQAIVLTGLTDRFALAQAIDEARTAS
jgi:hypothetical protein